ncbi:MAG: hypothetical protein ACHREM_15230 [Polyangiales bacterium]
MSDAMHGRLSRRGLLSAMALIGVGSTLSLSALAATSTASSAAPAGSTSASTSTSVAAATMVIEVFEGAKTGKPSTPPAYPELKNAPWNQYDTYTLHGTHKLALKAGTTASQTLANGATIEVTLQPPKSPPKVTFDLVIKDKKGAQLLKSTVTVATGAHHLPISLPFNTGNLVPALTVN